MNTQPEIFTVIFNSTGSNVLSIGIPDPAGVNADNVIQDNKNYNTVTYDVNWFSFLPTKYKKFQCQFVFKSEYFGKNYSSNTKKNYMNNGIINMNIGRTNKYDGLQMSDNIGLIQGVSNVDGNNAAGSIDMLYYGSLYYCSTTNDNNSFVIDYPLNNQITISINNFNKDLLLHMSKYCMYLTLTGILDNEIDKSN